jgi:hypothetical protein
MARTIGEIQNGLIAQVQSDPVLAPLLTSASRVAIWRLWTHVVAVCFWTIEKLQDAFRIETDEKIASLKPGSLRWYAEMARKFQYGYNLVTEADYYDNTGIDDADIEASKIIDSAAVVEQTRGIRIKVAKFDGTDLVPLTDDEMTAFAEYMRRVTYAGVKRLPTTAEADSLAGNIDVYYNPLVINSAGGRIDGVTSTPVLDAFKTYLLNLPFNGRFVLQNLVDVLQKVDGVDIIDIREMKAKYALLPYSGFSVEYLPDAGYLRIYAPGDMQFNFIPYAG